MTRVLVVLAAAGLVAFALSGGRNVDPSLSEPEWKAVAPGLEFARVEAQRYCREGDPGVAAVRIDPARCRIAPYAETEYAEDGPAGIDLWQRRLGVPVVFNAGLFDETRRHLGILRRQGMDLGGQTHRRWQGLLAADAAADSLPAAAVLDLSDPEQRARAARYATAVQSMMLFDRNGRKRVRISEDAAPRTLVAETGDGRLVILVTEGGYTLSESADLLMESGWGLVVAMAMDGGRESNLAVESPAGSYRSYRGESNLGRGFLRMSVSLPAVIAVEPDSSFEPR